jgi:signal transduction histidine kinase/ActR/RegA family two-component response regulator
MDIVKEKAVTDLLDEAFSIRSHNLKKSITLAEEALAISQALQNRILEAKCLAKLAFFQMITSNYLASIPNAEKALAFFQQANDEIGIAETKYTIASVYYKTDKLHLGLKNLLECLAIYKRNNDFASQAKVYKTIGTIYEFFEDVDNAIKAYQKCIALATQLGDFNVVSNAYNPLSGILLNQGRIVEAMDMIEKSIALKKQTNDVRGMAFSYYGRGKIYAKLNEYAKAKLDFDAALRIHKDFSENLGEIMVLHKQAILLYYEGDMETAKVKLSNVLALSEQYNIHIFKSKSTKLLYTIYKGEQNLEQSFYYLEKCLVQLEDEGQIQHHQILSSYNLIYAMETKSLQDKMEVEKAAIIAKKNEAENLAKTKQEFLSNMSHEIRTPLNAIITITNLLQDANGEMDIKLLDSLQLASNNLMLLINDVLDFTKIDIGKMSLERQPVDIRKLVTNIYNIYLASAQEKGIELKLSLDAALQNGYMLDETKLSQILNNLIGNAIKFTDKGTVLVELKKVSEDKNSHEILVRVEDTGVGIPQDFLTNLFDVFTQPKSVTTKTKPGSGLGLSIVKKLVELHGSTIQVYTQEGEGSTFYFTLQTEPCAVTGMVEEKMMTSLAGLQVLLVEDNKINILVATRLLKKWGIDTLVVENGEEAIAITQRQKFDVILMDLHMPIMNGYDAAKHIRTTPNLNKHTKLFALSADIVASEDVLQQDFDGYLKKPIEIKELYRSMQRILMDKTN